MVSPDDAQYEQIMHEENEYEQNMYEENGFKENEYEQNLQKKYTENRDRRNKGLKGGKRGAERNLGASKETTGHKNDQELGGGEKEEKCNINSWLR